MGIILKISWRNIWRNKTRSWIIIAAVAIGIWSAIFLVAFYIGMIEQRVNSALKGEVSHLQLHHPSFPEDKDIKYTIPESSILLENIRRHPEVQAATARAITRGMIADPSGSAGVQINGVDPVAEDAVTGLKEKLTEGEYFPAGKPNRIIIGQKLASKLKLHLRSKVVISFQDTEGNIASGAFRICGIYKTNNTPYDETNVFVPINELNALNMSPGKVNEIAVFLHSNQSLEKVVAETKQKYPRLEVKSWKEIAPDVEVLAASLDQSMAIFMGIILLALAFGIINTMLMAVLERSREIGMLMALGMNKFKIFSMIVTETILLVLTGCPPGLILSWATLELTGRKGIDLSLFSDAFNSLGYESIVYPAISLHDVMVMMAMVVVTAILSSLFPARRALSLNPIETIRK